jgi:hypothetical protein
VFSVNRSTLLESGRAGRPQPPNEASGGRFRRALEGKAGKVIAALVLVVGSAAIYWSLKSSVSSETPDTAFSAMYIDVENGKPFRHTTEAGEVPPIVSPYSGKNTGYRAEACYWTASGEAKTDPTWVLLNETIGKPGPTFCPDCGRVVVGHNPMPVPGKKPPPTKDEYLASHRSASPAAVPTQSPSRTAR